MVKTKSIYEPPAAEDGLRLLVMRFWPRGIRGEKVEAWEKRLAPSAELVKEWKTNRIAWNEFTRRYREEMKGQTEVLEEWRLKARRQTVTLLCGCREEETCHRSLLARIISNPGE